METTPDNNTVIILFRLVILEEDRIFDVQFKFNYKSSMVFNTQLSSDRTCLIDMSLISSQFFIMNFSIWNQRWRHNQTTDSILINFWLYNLSKTNFYHQFDRLQMSKQRQSAFTTASKILLKTQQNLIKKNHTFEKASNLIQINRSTLHIKLRIKPLVSESNQPENFICFLQKNCN